jgi:hypothetical protein
MTDLGNEKFKINYCKTNELDLEYLKLEEVYNIIDITNGYEPFSISMLQNYNPIYKIFFEMNDSNYNHISLNNRYHFVNMKTVESLEEKDRHKQDVFIKFSPLVDPVRYMIGKYKNSAEKLLVLPNLTNKSDCLENVVDPNNAAYTDCFFSYLSSQLLHHHGFVHGIDFYGSFLGIQKKFKANVTDDLEYLHNSTYFKDNIGILFSISETQKNDILQYGSRGNKKKLVISTLSNDHNISAISVLDIDSSDNNNNSENVDDSELVYNKSIHSSSSSSSSCDSDKSDLNYTSEDESVEEKDQEEEDEDEEDEEDEEEEEEDDEDEEDEDEEEEEEEDDEEEEDEIFAYINDFPMQMICLEKCKGTIDELFEKDTFDNKEGASAMMQIVMTLITYQKAFQFTHNDLHTNNIMYIETDQEYLYYIYNGKYYKVPTYGRIYKIIDFGRSIYKFQGKLFCSNSFASGGDAATQYNFEPYMDEDKPRLEPNMSFDLCRLGCSIFDFMMEIDDDPIDLDDFQETIYRWCLDDNGKNFLYKKNGDERYPNFKLYKMIARTAHKQLPHQQLYYPFFAQFEISEKKMKKIESPIMNIDKIPVYV